MKTFTFSVLSLLSFGAAATPIAQAAPKQAYFLLAGDSTTATQSTGGGGWGNGFLNLTLQSSASGKNYGHNGATTKSFRDGGDWATVLSEAKAKTEAGKEVFVTIQFGHNDQKSTSGVSLQQYSANLETFARQVQALNATPILVTPLTRRNFKGTPPRINENLATQRNLTIEAALATNSRYIDLNRASTDYVNKIGPNSSYVYNLDSTDFTHLNARGSVVFGRLVSDLLVAKYKDIKLVTKADKALSEKIAKGVAA